MANIREVLNMWCAEVEWGQGEKRDWRILANYACRVELLADIEKLLREHPDVMACTVSLYWRLAPPGS